MPLRLKIVCPGCGASYPAEERFCPDLALLAGLIADGALRPCIVEHSWRDIARVGPLLRDRQIAGKAVFHIDQT